MKSVIVMYKGQHDEEFEEDLVELFLMDFGLLKEESGPLWNERWYVKFGEKESQ